MLSFLTHLSDTQLFCLLSAVFIIISIAAITVVQRVVPHEMRYKDNPVLGNISGLISIIYGVLAGLTALYLVNNISYTEEAIQHEANAIANIYRDSKWLKQPAQGEIQTEMRKYLDDVINIDWPLMRKGEALDGKGAIIINNMSVVLSKYRELSPAELIIVQDIMQEIKTLYNARQQRIHMSRSGLNSPIWVVIIIGTILMVAINYLFGMNFYFHMICVCAVALMATSIIYLLLTLDKPFQGEFIIEPDGFLLVQAAIENKT